MIPATPDRASMAFHLCEACGRELYAAVEQSSGARVVCHKCWAKLASTMKATIDIAEPIYATWGCAGPERSVVEGALDPGMLRWRADHLQKIGDNTQDQRIYDAAAILLALAARIDNDKGE